MNQLAERHLAKAEGYLAKGDGWYEKAADEIIAAMKADDTLSQRQVGERFGRSQKWVSELVRWRTSEEPGNSPAWQRGSHATVAEIRTGAKKLLTSAPMEQVEQLVAELPKERQQAIAAAAGNRYAQARQEHDEAERNLTPAQRKEREAMRAQTQEASSKLISGFATLGIVGHIEQATEEMAELNADHAINKELLGQIEEAVRLLVTELDVARAMLGLEGSEIR